MSNPPQCNLCGNANLNAHGSCPLCFPSIEPVKPCPGYGIQKDICINATPPREKYCAACASAEERQARGAPPAPQAIAPEITVLGETLNILDFVSDTSVRIAEARLSSGRECPPQDAINYAAELWVLLAQMQGGE